MKKDGSGLCRPDCDVIFGAVKSLASGRESKQAKRRSLGADGLRRWIRSVDAVENRPIGQCIGTIDLKGRIDRA
jgi:hypothetical protein